MGTANDDGGELLGCECVGVRSNTTIASIPLLRALAGGSLPLLLLLFGCRRLEMNTATAMQMPMSAAPPSAMPMMTDKLMVDGHRFVLNVEPQH